MTREMIVMMKCVAFTSVCGGLEKFSLLYNIGDFMVENGSRLLLNLG